jgi:hypothetical protein
MFIELLHTLVIGPLLVYTGNTYGNGLPKWYLYSLIITGFIVMLYHMSLVYKKGIKNGFMYLLHAVIFAPLLIYVGLNGENGFWGAYSVLIMIGFASIGYHGMKLIRKL